jgi:dTDP-glucose 4,6-dehydratase
LTTYLVTGGCGFIGSNFIRLLLKTRPNVRVINLDALTYAGNPDNVRELEDDEGYRFVEGNVCDPNVVEELAAQADVIVNLAAETHVDRSLIAPGEFIHTDVYGTYVLLEAARHHPNVQRILHMSTDEVYGDVPAGVQSQESDPLHPRSPYSASKAGAEMQCRAYLETYGLPVIIARPANNVGPRQHLEKLVPLLTTNAICDEPLPIYGDGQQSRDWLFVDDCCEALELLIHRGDPGEVYNIGADNHRYNIEVAETVLGLLGKSRNLIRFVEDRPGHDRRYDVKSEKIRALGWAPRHDFEAAISETVRWYAENRWWWEKVRAGEFKEYYEAQYGRRLAEAKPQSGDQG